MTDYEVSLKLKIEGFEFETHFWAKSQTCGQDEAEMPL